jgi:hypothetical protein
MLGQPGEVADLPWPGTPTSETWQLIPAGQKLGEVAGLFDKLDDEQIEEEVEALKARAQKA